MHVVGYHIFINLLFNRIKSNLVEYRQFVLIFGLVRTAFLFTSQLFRIKKNHLLFNNIISLLFLEIENEKDKHKKNYYTAKKEEILLTIEMKI